MNIYYKKQSLKQVLIAIALLIGFLSIWYTNKLVEELSLEERNKVELWYQGTKLLANSDNPNQDISFVFEVVKANTTVPVILVDDEGAIISTKNFKSNDEKYITEQLKSIMDIREPIVIELMNGHKNYIYYKDSTLLMKLLYYPYVQLLIIFIFILISYLAFSSSRKTEQNQVWLGMSKETAHQLGTPLSSLMGWIEIMRLQNIDKTIVQEIEIDVNKLQIIAERFSKIGSEPKLTNENVVESIYNVVEYFKTRTSSKINFQINFPRETAIYTSLNIALFEWVVENLCKNAMDAMEGAGAITIDLVESTQSVVIDISDTGKGIPKAKHKIVFDPGFTTKKRGWGLGLSLTKRIIESYHSGKVFVKHSELNKGTTFRIELNKIRNII